MKRAIALFLFFQAAFNCYSQTVEFSNKETYNKDAFTLEMTTDNPAFSIYYTLNGTRPTKANARKYAEPILISTTTPVSAVSIDDNDSVGAIATKTYIFLNDVYKQSAQQEGYPDHWSYKTASTYWPADYAMDTQITQSEEYKDLLDSAMLSIPTVCLTTDVSHLFSFEEDSVKGGIYIYTGKGYKKSLGDGWERPASIEYFDPKTRGSFQLNCGLLLHGGNSRNPENTPKHSFRVSFRKQYGSGKLKYRLFENSDAKKKFDHLVLRAGYNYSWLKNGSSKLYPQNIIQRTNAQYILDSFAKEVHHAMGHNITHRRFAHLYINGLYWGLYELCEKINDNFAADYLGGADEEYDVIDVAEIIDGTRDKFTEMFNTTQKVTASVDDAYYRRLVDDNLLDVENFIDYMLVNWYVGNTDWDHNNWRCMRNRVTPDKGFKYLVWDAETAFADVNLNKVSVVSQDKNNHGDPSRMIKCLKKNPNFLSVMQERIEKHLTRDGILTPSKAAELYEQLADEIDLAIIGESARWGDYRILTGETKVRYTRNDYWLKRKNDLLTNFFPQRTEILLKQLNDYGLYIPTGITNVRDYDSNGSISDTERSVARNLQGVVVDNTYHGIVIVNGRKIIR